MDSEAAGYSSWDLKSKFIVPTQDSVLALFFSVEAGGLNRDALQIFHFSFSDGKTLHCENSNEMKVKILKNCPPVLPLFPAIKFGLLSFRPVSVHK